MTAPSVAFSTWIWGFFDPLLVIAALWLGWKADQPGKIVIAAIAALGLSLIVDFFVTRLGIPNPAPLSRDGPMLLPVRSLGALVWATTGYVAHRLLRRF